MPAKQIYFLYATENQNVANNIKNQLQSSYLQWNDNPDAAVLENVLANNPQKTDSLIILALVSDNLLKSIDAMRNLSLFAQETGVHLLMPVIIPGQSAEAGYYPTSINTIQDTIAYRDFWYDEWIRLRKLGNTLEGEALEALEEEKNFSKRIQAMINPILRFINTAQPKTLEDFQEDNYQALFEALNLGSLTAEERNMPLQKALTLDYNAPSEELNETTNAELPFQKNTSPIIAETTSSEIEAEAEEDTIEAAESIIEEAIIETVYIDDEVHLPAFQEPFMLNIDEILDTNDCKSEEDTIIVNDHVAPNVVSFENGDKAIDNILVASHEENNTPETTEEDTVEDTVEALPQSTVETPNIETSSAEIEVEEDNTTTPLASEEGDNSVSRLYALAAYYLQAEQANMAAQYYEQIIQAEPSETRAFLALANIQARQLGDINAAERTYKKVLLSSDENAQIYYEYGLFLQHYQGSQQRRAIELFHAALELDAYFAPAYIALAKSYAESGQKDMAKMNYLQACILDDSLQDIELDRSFGICRPKVEETPVEIVEEITKPVNPNENTVVLVTGATSGIGKATAQKFLDEGYKVILTGRREDRLHAFKNSLSEEQQAQMQTLHFDIRDYANVGAYLSTLPEAFKNIDILINNAGLAKGLSPIHEGKWEDWTQMIDTNIKGLLAITRAISAQMVKNGHGHIINIGSVAGKEAYLNSNVYGATKAAVDMLTRNMRLDLHQHNIRVSAINPGMVETEFSVVRLEDQAKADKVYENIQPLTGEDIADTIYYVASRPAHVNIQDVLIFCTQQASAKEVNRSGRPDSSISK